MSAESADPGSEPGIQTWIVEVIVAAGLFVLGAVVAYNSWLLGAGWKEDGPGAGYFPFYIGLLICLSSAVVGFGALKHARHAGKVFVTYPQLKLVLTVLVPCIGFAIAVQLLGLYVGAFLFIAGFMIAVGKYAWGKSTLVAFCVAAVAFLMFEVWFRVPLFKGMLQPLRFLGY